MIRLTLPRLCGLVALVLLALVLMRPLMPVDETRYLSVAWEMRLSGDPFHLTRNFGPYTHKPPLLFWLINLVWLVTGVSEFAARLVGPAFATLSVWGVARLGRRFWPDDTGLPLAAAMALAGFSLFLTYGSATMFDAMLTVAVLVGIGALWGIGIGIGTGQGGWLMLGLAMALGIYAKGPVILIHLLPPLVLIRLWAPTPPRLGALAAGFALALLVALVLVALWLVPWALTTDPATRAELIWSQSAHRVAGGMAHDRPVWFLIVLLPLFLFPWCLSRPFWQGLRLVRGSDPAARLCGIWALSALTLFSLISSKQAHYLLPELPALALLIARARGDGRFALWPLAGGLAALTVHLGLAATGRLTPYDTAPMVRALQALPPAPLAVTGMTYNAELNFTARLTAPVATPDDPMAWARAHPDGLILAPLASPPGTAAPLSTLPMGGRAMGIWRAGDLISVPG